MVKITTFIFFSILTLTSCDILKVSKNKKGGEGEAFKGAVKDFWHFSTDDDGDYERSTSSSPIKDVWSIKDKSTKRRGRALVDVDADLQLDVKILKKKGFRLARHLLVDTRAQVVKIRFWSKGFRNLGGVFAVLLYAKDGYSWEHKNRNRYKYFYFNPPEKRWTTLTKKEIKSLKLINHYLKKSVLSKKQKSLAMALRATAADTKIPPAKLKRLVKKCGKMFSHPSK